MRLFKEKSNDINFFKHKYRINLKSLTRTQRYQIRNKNIQTFGQAELPWIGYADDLVLFFTDKESLLSGSELLNQVFESFGLVVNKLKTETMVLNHQILDQHYQDTIISLDEIPIKNVTNFTYLGSKINHDEPNTGNTEVNNRIQMASSKFNEMSNLLQNQRVNLRTRINFLDSLVRSRLTYACQNWNLTKNQFERLNVSYRSFLRRMIRNGQKFVNPTENDYRLMISNERLHEICHTRDVEYFIRDQQTKYMSHVTRMDANRSIKQLAFNDDKYTKRGRPVRTLFDQVLENLNISTDEFCTLALKSKN